MLASLLDHLVVDEDDAEGLSKHEVRQPEQQIVRVRRDHVLELSLDHHAGNVDHHEEEGDEVQH